MAYLIKDELVTENCIKICEVGLQEMFLFNGTRLTGNNLRIKMALFYTLGLYIRNYGNGLPCAYHSARKYRESRTVNSNFLSVCVCVCVHVCVCILLFSECKLKL